MKRLIDSLPTALHVMQSRDKEIMVKYGIRSLLHRNIDLYKIKINTFCELSVRLLLDPDLLFSFSDDEILLPELKQDYMTQSVLMVSNAEKLTTKELVGKRLRYYRKLCEMTGAEVARLWSDGTSRKITQATVSNHETARFGDIRLVDILSYIDVYNSNMQFLPEPITLNNIIFGCRFSLISGEETLPIGASSNTNLIQPGAQEQSAKNKKTDALEDLILILPQLSEKQINVLLNTAKVFVE